LSPNPVNPDAAPQVSVELSPMTPRELGTYLGHAKADYVQQRIEFGGESADDAAAAAERDFGELFPGGEPAKNQYLFTARDAGGERVGLLWLAKRERFDQQYVWIYDIHIDESRRRQGCGRALMAYAERWTKEHDMSEIVLNVFGGNTSARQLYLELGYVERAVTMSKKL
jgi:GNAT superfamily N-acetyltransferase